MISSHFDQLGELEMLNSSLDLFLELDDNYVEMIPIVQHEHQNNNSKSEFLNEQKSSKYQNFQESRIADELPHKSSVLLESNSVEVLLDDVTDKTDNDDKISSAEDYRCWPPTWFMITISIVQLLLFVHYQFIENLLSHRQLLRTVFLWKPTLTLICWRFFIYSLYHIGWVHLFFNICVQLCLGVPLEMIHGGARVALLYITGVVVGSLSAVLVDPEVVLVGSSGGVYALLAAHVADITLNYSNMELGRLKLLAIATIAIMDVILSWLNQTTAVQPQSRACPVSHVAHVTGAIIGLLIGLAVLKVFSKSLLSNVIQKTARGFLFFLFVSGCLLILVVDNLPK